jgi:MSHA biogenesis protein MshJ
MNNIQAQLAERYNALNFRERVLVALTVLAVTWAIWLNVGGGYVIDNRAIVVTDLDRVAVELAQQHAERNRLLGAGLSEHTAALTTEREQLIAELDLTDAELQEALARFVAPEEIPVLLEDVIAGHEKLELIRIETQSPTALALGPESTLQVYRHPVQVELKGSYMDLLAYLKELESSGWGFSWRKLEYVVEDYPGAHVLIEVETLSREQGWLGV